KDDVQTIGFNTYPEMIYDAKLKTEKVTGYRVSHSLQIMTKNIEEVGELLDAVVTNKGEAAGVNVNGISWDSDKKTEAEASVLQDSVKNARKHAEQLAAAAGVSIKAVHKIQHTSYSSQPPSEPLFEKASFAAAPSMAPPTQLSTGTIKVRVEVQMEFEI
ncbi:MAG: SIMPL domain-containing protein, partial [Pseudobdellovibrio sp.]